ncbi:DNA-processing protein DprA [Leucobacter sp. W1153]|uniref:DNA-processing protein DprA n=1 Tax=Leucobacter sp. W1153 TaxID=3439064 RepID=UPI003F3D55B7
MATLTDLAHDERSARILLSLIGAPNDAATGRLLTRIGAVELIALTESSTDIPGMDQVAAAVWRDRPRAHGSVDRLTVLLAESERFRVLTPDDAEWPDTLSDLGERAPYVLWAKGNTALLTRDSSERVTITGSRAATAYGVHVTEEIADQLVRADRVIVAGGAYGVEASAHRAALARNGSTIAVLAAGVDRPYPAGHTVLIDRIASQGLVISEVPPGHAPTRQRFIDRSRILAAISGTSVVVEAGARSGTLHTAREALALGRAVGAVPGPVTSAASTGTNRLLQDGQAQVITSGSDVVRLLDAMRAPVHPAPDLNITRLAQARPVATFRGL